MRILIKHYQSLIKPWNIKNFIPWQKIKKLKIYFKHYPYQKLFDNWCGKFSKSNIEILFYSALFYLSFESYMFWKIILLIFYCCHRIFYKFPTSYSRAFDIFCHLSFKIHIIWHFYEICLLGIVKLLKIEY